MGSLIWIILTSVILIALAIALVWYLVNNWLNINKRLCSYVDVPTSNADQKIYYKVANTDANKELFNAKIEDLTVYAMGNPVKKAKVKSIENERYAFHIEFPENITHMELLQLVGGVKYERIEISTDDGKTRIHLPTRSVKIGKKIDYQLIKKNKN